MKKVRKKTSDAGHDIVADGWAGAANPLFTPNTPPNTLSNTKNFKTLVFPLFDLCSRTNGLTDQRTDEPTGGQSLLQSFVSATEKVKTT